MALFKLLNTTLETEGSLISHTQVLGEKLYFDGQLDNYEAIAKDTVTNAFMVFVNSKILRRVKVTGDSKNKALELDDEYKSEENLTLLVAKLQSYRLPTRKDSNDQNATSVKRLLDFVKTA